VIQLRRLQRSFGDGLIAAEVKDLHDAWMPHVDVVLADDEIIATVHQALAQRHPNSRRRGRLGFSAEVVLRLLILKHLRNWSYQVLEREVRTNLVYRDFTRVGSEKVPDAKTMGRWGVALGPTVIDRIHEQIVQIAQAQKIVHGRSMRVDTTVVESNVHYPTDSGLLGDGVRVLIRTMRKITKLTGEVGAKLRDRSRSVKLRVLEIARAARSKAAPGRDKMQAAYGTLLEATRRVLGQAKLFSKEIGDGVKSCTDVVQQPVLEGQCQLLDQMVPRVQQVIRQTKARIFDGDTRSSGKLVSAFEPSTEVIRKGKAGKPAEFGKLVNLQEAENQIIIDFEVYAQSDAGFDSEKNEAAATAKGVKRVCIPNRSTKSVTRKQEQKKKRWFRNGQRWRVGCEGRISASKRRHGLSRCRYRGDDEMKRWVGLGVIADILIDIGRAINNRSAA
jgi:transposase, IS5 family